MRTMLIFKTVSCTTMSCTNNRIVEFYCLRHKNTSNPPATNRTSPIEIPCWPDPNQTYSSAASILIPSSRPRQIDKQQDDNMMTPTTEWSNWKEPRIIAANTLTFRSQKERWSWNKSSNHTKRCYNYIDGSRKRGEIGQGISNIRYLSFGDLSTAPLSNVAKTLPTRTGRGFRSENTHAISWWILSVRLRWMEERSPEGWEIFMFALLQYLDVDFHRRGREARWRSMTIKK